MGAVNCRSCDGKGRKWLDRPGKYVDCRACEGSGRNKHLWSKSCERGCGREIVYKIGSTPPRFCPNCRNIQLEKRCEQSGCTNTIRYQVSWDNVPTYCKRCETKRREGATASTCPGTGFMGCGKLVWSPPGKKFTHCPECSQRLREQEAAKWKEKSCPGLAGQGYCGNTIKYRVDWNKVPDICPKCIEKAKSAKADRDSKMREKSCARNGCNNTIRYSTDWEHPPSFCKSCNDQRVKVDSSAKGSMQAKDKNGNLLFTFGRCTPPPAQKQGGRSKQQREWAGKGYYWVAMPGAEHETFIITSNPVEKGFIQQSSHVTTLYSSASLRNGWQALAVAVLGLNELQ